MVLHPEEQWLLSEDGAAVPSLIRVWDEAIVSLWNVAAECPEDQWALPTPCPGWTVSDVIAHTIGLELDFRGDPAPDHEPDWATLPHVSGALGEYIEVSVDYRRGRTKSELLAELDDVIKLRRQDLAQISDDPNEMTPGPAGFLIPRSQMLQTRILDLWIHEQDIRIAVDRPGGLDSDAAFVTAGRLSVGLPRMWGKTLGANGDQVLRVEVTGPGVEFTKTIAIGDDGRAHVVSNGHWDTPIGGDPAPGNLLLQCSFPAYVALAAGRHGIDKFVADGQVLIAGDQGLADRLIPAMAVTP